MATKPYTDNLLTGVAVKSHRQQAFLAEEVLPVATGRKQTGSIARIDEKGETIRTFDDEVGKGGLAEMIDHDVDNDTQYNAVKHQGKKAVPWEDEANADSEFAAHSDATLEVTERLDLNKEVNLHKILDANLTGSQTATLAGGARWDDYTNSDPLVEFKNRINVIEALGFTPNFAGMSAKVARTLILHPDVRGVGAGVIRAEEELGDLDNMQRRLSAILGMDVRIAKNIRNVAKAGQEKSVEQVWGAKVLICVREPKPSLQRPYSGLGLTVKWNTGNVSGRGAGGVMNGKRVQRWTDEDREAEIVKVTDFYHQILTNKKAGFLLKSVIN